MDVFFKRPDGTFVIQVNGYPYHAIPGDPLFVAAQAAGVDAPFEPEPLPPEPVQTTQITFAQLLIGLVTEGWITEAEGGGWLVGTLPAPVLAVIATLPSNQQFAAKARAIRPSAVVRADPLVAALAAAEGKSSADIDAFFTTYAAS